MEMPATQANRELPTFDLRNEDLPEIDQWDVGSKHYLIIKVETISRSSHKALGLNDSGDENKVEGSFRVLNVKALGNVPVDAKTLEKKDFEKVVASAKSGMI